MDRRKPLNVAAVRSVPVRSSEAVIKPRASTTHEMPSREAMLEFLCPGPMNLPMNLVLKCQTQNSLKPKDDNNQKINLKKMGESAQSSKESKEKEITRHKSMMKQSSLLQKILAEEPVIIPPNVNINRTLCLGGLVAQHRWNTDGEFNTNLLNFVVSKIVKDALSSPSGRRPERRLGWSSPEEQRTSAKRDMYRSDLNRDAKRTRSSFYESSRGTEPTAPDLRSVESDTTDKTSATPSLQEEANDVSVNVDDDVPINDIINGHNVLTDTAVKLLGLVALNHSLIERREELELQKAQALCFVEQRKIDLQQARENSYHESIADAKAKETLQIPSCDKIDLLMKKRNEQILSIQESLQRRKDLAVIRAQKLKQLLEEIVEVKTFFLKSETEIADSKV